MKTSDSLILFRWLFPGLYAVLCRQPAGRLIALLLGFGVGFAVHTVPAGPRQSDPTVGPTGVIVQTQFGGQIFGFDFDQASTKEM